MKHVSVVFSCCYGCPFCDHDDEDRDGKIVTIFWCQKLQTNAHSSWWGEDRVLPGCPLDEYEPRDGDQIDKYYHLTRKAERDTEQHNPITDIIGKWPGDESDAEFDELMREHEERD